MKQQINAHYLAPVVPEDQLLDRTVVVIDVLRATTTLVYAFAAGAKEVIPCATVENAREIAAQLPDKPLLGGERGGVRIEGFDLGNSPADYRPEMVAGRTIVFTTTNGAQAMMKCRKSRRLLVAGFVNLSALVNTVRDDPSIELLCAGTQGKITAEDVLLAGAITDRLIGSAPGRFTLNDEAVLAALTWQGLHAETAAGDTLLQALRASQGGKNVAALGMSADIEVAAQVDTHAVIPVMDFETWRLTR
jgi:2-phosphosulfolactate phosphatase